MPHSLNIRRLPLAAAALALCAALPAAQASSHREAPYIATQPKVDATDFYMFSSYEADRSGYVTLIANYLPLQDAYGGPNYFSLDANALYEIHVDNNGDAKEDLSFQFRFKNTLKGITLPINGKNVAIPLIQAGAVTDKAAAALNLNETFTVDLVRGDRRSGSRADCWREQGDPRRQRQPGPWPGRKRRCASAGDGRQLQPHFVSRYSGWQERGPARCSQVGCRANQRDHPSGFARYL